MQKTAIKSNKVLPIPLHWFHLPRRHLVSVIYYVALRLNYVRSLWLPARSL